MDTIRLRAGATVLLALALFAMGGCDDKAREFASKAQQLLNQRSEQLSRKIAAEKAAYNSSAAHAAEDNRALVDSSLQNERNERADALAADYTEARRPVSLWRKDLADYAKVDYDNNRQLLTEDFDASSRYLQTFANLTIEQDKVDALSKLLAALAKKPSLKDDIVALGAFAGDTKTDFDKKVCTDLKSRNGNQDDAARAAQKAYDAKGCAALLK